MTTYEYKQQINTVLTALGFEHFKLLLHTHIILISDMSISDTRLTIWSHTKLLMLFAGGKQTDLQQGYCPCVVPRVQEIFHFGDLLLLFLFVLRHHRRPRACGRLGP